MVNTSTTDQDRQEIWYRRIIGSLLHHQGHLGSLPTGLDWEFPSPRAATEPDTSSETTTEPPCTGGNTCPDPTTEKVQACLHHLKNIGFLRLRKSPQGHWIPDKVTNKGMSWYLGSDDDVTHQNHARQESIFPCYLEHPLDDECEEIPSRSKKKDISDTNESKTVSSDPNTWRGGKKISLLKYLLENCRQIPPHGAKHLSKSALPALSGK